MEIKMSIASLKSDCNSIIYDSSDNIESALYGYQSSFLSIYQFTLVITTYALSQMRITVLPIAPNNLLCIAE
jgi:hypothetical protein